MNKLLKSSSVSIKQKNRISKGHYQSLYLLEKTPTLNGVILKMTGSTLNVYTVVIEGLDISCDCPDSNNKSDFLFCKHACFVICIIGRIYEDNIFITGKFSQEEKEYLLFNIWRKKDFECDILTQKYSDIKFKVIDDSKTKIDTRNINEECVICYNEMKETDVHTCTECLNSVHKECLKRWMTENNICVFCRSYIKIVINIDNRYLNISK